MGEIPAWKEETYNKHREFWQKDSYLININYGEQGTGKTTANTDTVQEEDSTAIVAPEHEQIERELAPNILGAVHRKGFKRWLEEDYEGDDATKELALEFHKQGIEPKMICSTLWAEETGFQQMLKEDPPWIDPPQFLRMQRYEEVEKVRVDEWRPYFSINTFSLTEAGMMQAKEDLKENVNPAKLQRLITTLKTAKEQVEELKLDRKMDSRKDVEALLKEGKVYGFKTEEGYALYHVDQPFDMRNVRDAKLLVRLSQRWQEVKSDVNSVLVEAVREGNVSKAGRIARFKDQVYTLLSAYRPVMVCEEAIETGNGIQSNAGTVPGENTRCHFFYYRPLLFRLLELSEKGVDVKIGWAGFDEERFNHMRERYQEVKTQEELFSIALDYFGWRYRASTRRVKWRYPEKYNQYLYLKREEKREKYGGMTYWQYAQLRFNDVSSEGDEFLNPALPKVHYQAEDVGKNLPPITAGLVQAQRRWKGSWSRSALGAHNGWSTWRNDLLPYMEKVVREGEAEVNYRHIIILDDNHFWGGSGLKGSNKFVGKNTLHLIGTPNKPPQHYLLTHFLLFHELPPLEWRRERETSVIPEGEVRTRGHSLVGYDDERLDLIHKTEVRDEIVDAAMRLRPVRGEEGQGKTVYRYGIIPEGLKEMFGAVETITLPELTAQRMVEDGADDVVRELMEKKDDVKLVDVSNAVDFTHDVQVVEDTVRKSGYVVRRDGTVKERERAESKSDDELWNEYIKPLLPAPTGTIKEAVPASPNRVTDILRNRAVSRPVESDGPNDAEKWKDAENTG